MFLFIFHEQIKIGGMSMNDDLRSRAPPKGKSEKELYMKIIRGCLWALELCLVIIGIVFSISRIMGVNSYVVLSGSMEPTISTGSVVLVDTKDRDYRVGDVISYWIDDKIVTHRIVKIHGNVYKTKGDSNEIEDSFSVELSQIIGKVKFRIPKLGYFISYLKSKKIVLLMIMAVFLTSLFDILSEKNTQKITIKHEK